MTEVRSEIVSYQVDDLIPYENNPKNHPANQIDQIVDSINEWGWTMPLLIDEQNNVIAGHGRLLAAKKLGINEVPCIVAREWSDEKKKAYCIADNKLTENSTWSKDFLKLNFEFLIENDFDLSLTGFNADEIADLIPDFSVEEGLTDEDDVPEIPEEPVTKLGDIWLLGEHRVMCGDSTSNDSIDALIKNKKINVIFTDPPYGIGLDKDNQTLGKSKKYSAVLNDQNNNVAKKVYNLSVNLNIEEMYFWGANHYASVLPDSSCWIVWDKQGGKSVTYADCELCYTNAKKPVRMFTHIWDGFRRDSEKNQERLHATQKPIQLFIDIWTKFETGKSILDLFGGSGSTIIACEKTARHCYMMELDPKYCDVIIKRWQDFTGREAILEATSESFNSLQ